MQAYICDSCGKVMTDPYHAKMREFYQGLSFEGMRPMAEDATKEITIHLCNDCFKGLNTIYENKLKEEAETNAKREEP